MKQYAEITRFFRVAGAYLCTSACVFFLMFTDKEITAVGTVVSIMGFTFYVAAIFLHYFDIYCDRQMNKPLDGRPSWMIRSQAKQKRTTRQTEEGYDDVGGW